MGKISKTDQDPHQIEKDREELRILLNKKSEHFAEDTYIIVNNRRAKVVFDNDGFGNMIVFFDEGFYQALPNPNLRRSE